MSSRLHTISFAAILCIVCSALLTLASTGLKQYQLQNMATDRMKNILKSAGLIHPEEKTTPATIHARYADNIEKGWVDAKGNLITETQKEEHDLPVYLHLVDGKMKSYILPVQSKGLWGKIYGYISLDSDGTTVAGFTVYSHNETPGLGGEIEKAWFQNNFKGKKITADDGKFVSVAIAKGKAENTSDPDGLANRVDGISGATLTGRYLTAGLKETLIRYEDFSRKIRNGDRDGPGEGVWDRIRQLFKRSEP